MATAADQATEAEQRLRALDEAIEVERKRASALDKQRSEIAGEVDELRARMVAAAIAVQRHEAAVSALTAELTEIETLRAQQRKALAEKRKASAETLGALYRLSARPLGMLAATGNDVNEAVRSSLVLRSVLPAVEQRAASLRQEVEALSSARADMISQRRKLNAALTDLGERRRQLAALAEEKTKGFGPIERDRHRTTGRIERMTEQSRDLNGLLERLEQRQSARLAAARAERARRASEAAQAPERPSTIAPAQAPIGRQPIQLAGLAGAHGKLIPPAHGKLILPFGAGDGREKKGAVYRTGANATVVSPFDGRVAYAGPFRGYGLLLIVEHGEGYHSLLTGFARIDAVVGQWVLAGEPLGVMGATNDARRLYVELRQKGEAVDPVPWLSNRRG